MALDARKADTARKLPPSPLYIEIPFMIGHGDQGLFT